MLSEIVLSEMEFYGFHGCFAEEKIIGTHFKVDLTMKVDISEASQHDDVLLTVNYQSVYQDIKKIMERPVNILETLCSKILSMIRLQYPQVVHAEVKVCKMNPAIGGKVKYVAVSSQF
ncbi:MAG: dihydroneopterin aldolase [Bacteroidales bacterium]|jgi:dihydroneopterin aldolase